jgi:hypothetical protein
LNLTDATASAAISVVARERWKWARKRLKVAAV